MPNFVRPIFAALVVLLATGPAQAAPDYDRLDVGLRVGTAIPHQFGARDQTGTRRSFRSLRGRKGLILIFNRSFEW